jgi:sigma-54 dependent transcriptional regulator, acetoin dehydrogenase operon transcriptional activator AcoR
LPLDLQPVLLRALEEGVIYRLGDTQPRRVDVRLLAMTNRNLREEVECGRFRADLYYRVGVTRICIPGLKERDGDVDLLIDHFNRALALRHGVPAREFPGIVMDVLRAYSWPGNVRELRNVVENLLLTSNDERVTLAELPAEVLDESPAARDKVSAGVRPGSGSLEESERFAIARALRHAQGNMAQAARALGVSRSTLYRKMEHYRMRPDMASVSPD